MTARARCKHYLGDVACLQLTLYVYCLHQSKLFHRNTVDQFVIHKINNKCRFVESAPLKGNVRLKSHILQTIMREDENLTISESINVGLRDAINVKATSE